MILIWIIAILLSLTHLTWAWKPVLDVLRHLGFRVLLSPAAYLFFAAMTSTVLLPLYWAANAVEVMKQGDTVAFRVGLVAKAVLTLAVYLTVLHFLAWGSMPIDYDSTGAERMRMIPFLPWPSTPFI
jgi:hypothetical protein